MSNGTTNLHIYFVLDRSGSMQSMAADVIGGFNSFLSTQKADGADAVMSVIHFDTEDAHEVPVGGPPSTTPWATPSPMPPSEPSRGDRPGSRPRRSCS
jgi:hypothetical protein